MGTTATLAGRIGRHALLYAVGTALFIAAGIATLAVFTRLMPPAEFGKLVVLMALANGITILFNLATLQGTIGLVFGGGEDDDVLDLDEDDPALKRADAISERREILGTGLLLTAMVAIAGSAVLWANAPVLSRLLFDNPADAAAVRLAAAAGGLGAFWQLLLTVPRFERRPRVFVPFNVSRPILALALGIPFVSGGAGAEGVLWGLIIATVGLTAIALIYLRRTYRVRFHAGLVPIIIRLGAVFVPISLLLYVVNRGGILLLSGSVSQRELGLYGVAATFAIGISTLAGVFFMAWIPMKRTSLFQAVYKERGYRWMFSKLTTFYLMGVGLLYVLLVAGSGALVAIASSEYSEAGVLFPALGAAAVAQAGFLLAYRISAFPRKRLALGGLAMLATLAFVGVALALIPQLGVHGVPGAAFAAVGTATVTMLALNQRGPRPIPFEYGRLAVIALIVGTCVGAHSALMDTVGPARPLLGVATALAYPGLLLSFRAIRLSEAKAMLRVVRQGVAEHRRGRAAAAESLHRVPAEQVQMLRAAAHPGGGGNGSPDPTGLVAGLRQISPSGPPTKRDDAIGRYLLSDRSRAERDALARDLWRRGVSPADLDRLEQTLDELASLPVRAWPSVAR